MPDWKNADHWEVVLHITGKGLYEPELITYYSMGIGHKGKKPTMQQVLDCVASDAAGYEDSGSFEEWAMNYGYNPDDTLKGCDLKCNHLNYATFQLMR